MLYYFRVLCKFYNRIFIFVMKKRLVAVIGSMRRGGAERVMSVVTNRLAEKGWEVWIAALLTDENEYELNENVHFVDFSGKCESRIKRLPYWIKSIRHLVKTVKPDTVLSFIARINVITLLSLFGLKQRIVVSERNDPRFDRRGRLGDIMTKLLYRLADTVVFQTKRSAEYFEKCHLKNTCIIYNPIDVDCRAENTVRHKIVNVGRLNGQKNQKMLIEAISDLKDKYPDISLHIYGEGDLRDELIAYINEKSASENVILEGMVTDVHNRISDAELFVLSSNYEGLSNALFEAMLMGLPCISTNCGSEEFITDGVNGRITERGDAHRLADVIDQMLSHPEKARAMGKEAMKLSDVLSAEKVLSKWEALFE